jgi:hypothetical protein
MTMIVACPVGKGDKANHVFQASRAGPGQGIDTGVLYWLGRKVNCDTGQFAVQCPISQFTFLPIGEMGKKVYCTANPLTLSNP